MAKKLQVVSTPDKKLVFENSVYVSPTSSFAGAKYISIKGYPYAVKTHAEVKADGVALSQPQRTTAKCNLDDVVECNIWNPVACNIYELKLECDIPVKKRTEIKEDDLAKLIRTRLSGQPLSKDQEFLLSFEGAPVQLLVKSCLILSADADKKGKDHITKFAPHGLVCDSEEFRTDIEIEPVKNRLLVWTKSTTRRSVLFKPDWKFEDMGIGGLDSEFASIFRRAFASRLFPPSIISELGIKHVKGMLLYGPPGTGKTLIARQIGKMLANKEPKIVNGPEILNKYVGQSEENIRKLFEEAERDFKEHKENAELHIIIFDEIDAICKQRGSSRSGTDVHDTVVNQLLSKIDGVESLENILVIGMTNRKDMIDSALLRPGRLEVHVEIGLPDEEGRLAIFKIHTKKMSDHGRLAPDVDLKKLAERTKNFSGAEIEGVVKSASSFALYGSINVTKGAVAAKKELGDILISMSHFERALDEVTPAFGVQEDELKNLVRGRLYNHGPDYNRLLSTVRTLIEQVRSSESTSLLSVLLQGKPGTGKTAIAAHLGLESKFPYVKLISPENLIGVSEAGKCSDIAKMFEDSYKSPLSLIIIDDIERLLEYVAIGPRFSNSVLQTLLVVCKRAPPVEGRKLLILATTSSPTILKDMKLRSAFNVVLNVPQLTKPDQVSQVVTELGVEIKGDVGRIASCAPMPVGIKQLLVLLEMARQGGRPITPERLTECVDDSGLKDDAGYEDMY